MGIMTTIFVIIITIIFITIWALEQGGAANSNHRGEG